MSTPLRLLALLLMVSVFFPLALVADQSQPYWPVFHGPRGDNKSPDAGLLKKWPASGPKLAWKTPGIGEGYSGIVTADGRLFTEGNKGENTVVTCLDMNGKILWQEPNGPAYTGSFEGSRSTPTIDGDYLYHLNPLGDVACFDVKSGDKKWTVNILKRFDGKNIRWALAESLRIDGDNVICTPGGKKGVVAALNKKTGATVWAAPTINDDTSYATATITEFEGIRMILAMTAGNIVGVNADNGKLLFKFPFPAKYDINALQPVFHDGEVFISHGYGRGSTMLDLTARGTSVTAKEKWSTKDMDNHHGGVVLLDGYLYGAAHNNNAARWICLDWKTGKMMYAEKGVGKGSLTYADGMLYTMSEKGKVGLVKASPTRFDLVSTFDLPKDGSGPTWAHPVVIGGRLYIRHGNYLFAYEVKDKAAAGDDFTPSRPVR